jgi:hypothetical protein
MLAKTHIGNGGGIEMVNFAYFGETYTNNVRFHAVHYTVSAIGGRDAPQAPIDLRAEMKL